MSEERSGREVGTVRVFWPEKGYGFVLSDHGGSDLFVHASQLPPGLTTLKEGDRVSFALGVGRNGKPMAVRVTPAA